jgi:hypothetical protein
MTQTRLRFFITTALTIMVVVMLASGTTIWHHEHLMFEESLFFVGIALAGFGAAEPGSHHSSQATSPANL